MGHNRLKMEIIKKESTRMQTFNKRKKSIVKKISELSILCGVEACLIIFRPKIQNEAAKLDTVWPSSSDSVRKIIDKYKKTDQARRSYNIDDYFYDKRRKLETEISKFRKQIHEAKYPSWDSRLEKFSEDELRSLVARLDNKIHVIEQKLNRNKFIESQATSNNFQIHPNTVCCWPVQNSCIIPSCLNYLNLSYPNWTMLSRSNLAELQYQKENMGNDYWGISNVAIGRRQSYGDNRSLGSNMETVLPHMQVPTPSFPYHQILPSQVDMSNYQI